MSGGASRRGFFGLLAGAVASPGTLAQTPNPAPLKRKTQFGEGQMLTAEDLNAEFDAIVDRVNGAK